MTDSHCNLVIRALATIASFCALAIATPAAQAQQDWAYCAEEGQTCQVRGEAMLRFGVEGRYLFRITRDQQPCTVEAFGSDPAPGLRKRCEVSLAWRSDSRYRSWRDPAQQGSGAGWRFCAVEGEACAVNGNARVRFGADGRYATRQVTGSVACRVSIFGDPAPGRPKTCEAEDTSGWALCANEGDLCSFNGTAQVRYGANGQYAERSATGPVACNNGTFGDPLPGVAKQCEVQRTPGAPAVAGLPWNACAREGGSCNFRGAGMLRYGADGRYAYREAINSLPCNNDSFGGDPAPGAVKQCELLRIGR